jgi:DNA anti-recombination protein RmuC
MGLGGTAKKLQKVTNAAEELYTKMNEVIGQLKELQGEVERTSEQVDRIEYDVAEQRAILEAIADAQDVDVDAVIESADLPPDPEEAASPDEDEASAAEADGADEAPSEG